MAQKDYVSRAKKGGQRKKTTSRKKKVAPKNSSGMWILVIVIVAAFAGGLYFIKNNKSDPTKPSRSSSNDKQTSDAIPPTPNKRWVYVDALVNPGIHSNGSNAENSQDTVGMSPEQQRILSMMAADRPQNTTESASATYNQQVDRNSQNEQKPSQTVTPSESVKTTANTVATNRVPANTATTNTTTANTAKANSTTTNTTSNNTTTANNNTSTAATPVKTQQWLLQCGSFRNKDGAESIKAQLALAGITSQITYSGNLHRVTVGPYKSKEAASKMQTQINNTGVHSCNIRG